MSPDLLRWARRLRVRLAGVRFSRAVERYERAAQELDRAVREVLQP